MFYGTESSYIEFPNDGGLDSRFSITLMCWVQPGGQDGPLFSYGSRDSEMSIVDGKLFHNFSTTERSEFGGSIYFSQHVKTAEVLPAGKWVHVAASFDHNVGIHSLYINGNLSISQFVGKAVRVDIYTTVHKVRMGTTGDRNRNFKGKIAEMKVYHVALNEAQIRQTSIRQGS